MGTLGCRRGGVDFLPVSQKLPWATIGWFTAAQTSATKTVIASLIDSCHTPQMMVHIFENSQVHDAVTTTIVRVLGSKSKAVVGQLTIVDTNILRASRSDMVAVARTLAGSATSANLPTEGDELFPPWQTNDLVAACWGWLFIFLAAACPLYVLRCLWLCCCQGACSKRTDDFEELSDLDHGNQPFSGH